MIPGNTIIQSLTPTTVPMTPITITISPAPRTASPTPGLANRHPIPAAKSTTPTITTAAKPITIAANKQNTAITIPAINARIPAPSGIKIGNPITTIAMIMANFSHLFVHGFFSWLS